MLFEIGQVSSLQKFAKISNLPLKFEQNSSLKEKGQKAQLQLEFVLHWSTQLCRLRAPYTTRPPLQLLSHGWKN